MSKVDVHAIDWQCLIAKILILLHAFLASTDLFQN